jgi:hypothetical protein
MPPVHHFLFCITAAINLLAWRYRFSTPWSNSSINFKSQQHILPCDIISDGCGRWCFARPNAVNFPPYRKDGVVIQCLFNALGKFPVNYDGFVGLPTNFAASRGQPRSCHFKKFEMWLNPALPRNEVEPILLRGIVCEVTSVSVGIEERRTF